MDNLTIVIKKYKSSCNIKVIQKYSIYFKVWEEVSTAIFFPLGTGNNHISYVQSKEKYFILADTEMYYFQRVIHLSLTVDLKASSVWPLT